MQHTFVSIGAFLAFISIAAGAFGAHLLKGKLSPESQDVFEVAVRYQMYHALALLLVAILFGSLPSLTLTIVGWLFISGVVIFSGSLYALVFSGVKTWGAVTPIGGVLLLLGWLTLLLGSFFTK